NEAPASTVLALTPTCPTPAFPVSSVASDSMESPPLDAVVTVAVPPAAPWAEQVTAWPTVGELPTPAEELPPCRELPESEERWAEIVPCPRERITSAEPPATRRLPPPILTETN